MRAWLLVFVVGCSDPILGSFDSTDASPGAASYWVWARHTKIGAALYTRVTDETPHCSDVAGADDPPLIELSEAALSAPVTGMVVAAPLDPSQPQAVVDFTGPPTYIGPYDTGTFELDVTGETLTGSVNATLSTGVTDPCCTPGKCTCWTAMFQDTPYCD